MVLSDEARFVINLFMLVIVVSLTICVLIYNVPRSFAAQLIGDKAEAEQYEYLGSYQYEIRTKEISEYDETTGEYIGSYPVGVCVEVFKFRNPNGKEFSVYPDYFFEKHDKVAATKLSELNPGDFVSASKYYCFSKFNGCYSICDCRFRAVTESFPTDVLAILQREFKDSEYRL